MSKWLLAISLLASTAFGAALEIQVTEEAANNAASTGSGSGGMDRRNQLMAMGSDGTVWLFYYGSANVDSLRVVRFDDWGTLYTFVRTPLFNRGNVNVHEFGDTIIAVQEREVGHEPYVFRGIGTTLDFDTIVANANIGNLDSRPGAFMIGNKPASYTTVDDASDSMNIFIADSWPIAGDWRQLGVTSTKYGSGLRSPTYNSGVPFGILIYETGASNDLNYWDSLASWTELSGTFYGNVQDYTDQTIMINDTAGLYIQQGIYTGSADSVYVGSFRLRGVGTGTVTISTPVTQQLLAAADNPVNILAYPNLTVVKGTDSVIAVWFQRQNAANTDSVDIMGCTSADEGSTWGTPFIIQPAVDGRDKHHLQIPNITTRDTSGDLILYMAYTPQQFVNDSIYFVIDTVEYAPAESATRERFHIFK